MKKFTILLVLSVFTNLSFAQDSSNMEIAIKNLVLSGIIKNFDELESLISPDTTYIQLATVPIDGKFKITANHGRRSFDSNFPKLPIPHKAAFTFKVSKVPAGKYYIVVQNLNPDAVTSSHGLIYAESPLFVTEEGKPFIILIPSDAKSPVTIDAGTINIKMYHQLN